jgi:hypothetical protein
VARALPSRNFHRQNYRQKLASWPMRHFRREVRAPCVPAALVGAVVRPAAWLARRDRAGEAVVDVAAAPVLSYADEVLSGARQYAIFPPLVPGTGGVGKVRAAGPDPPASTNDL